MLEISYKADCGRWKCLPRQVSPLVFSSTVFMMSTKFNFKQFHEQVKKRSNYSEHISTLTKMKIFYFRMSKPFNWMLAICLATGVSCSNPAKKPKYPEPLTPEQALKSFEVNKDFELEVFAAEPYVMDPVDMVVDEKGNVFVVGMPDYPFQPEPGKEKGNIRMLADTNNDGRIDTSYLFADHLSEATSILPWKGGLIVTAAPDILYLKDTTGDHKADVREVLFTGFFKANPEAQITSLRFGVDNWIYANNRGQAGTVSSVQNSKAPALNMQGADFRFRLDRGKFELETGPGQFGQTINDWGHRFFTENTIHIQQAVISWRYTHRHNYLPNMRAVINVSDHDLIMFQKSETPYWRQARTDARNRNYKEQNLDRVEYARDHFTGASGGTLYEGGVYPQEYYGNVFTGEVSGNLVHRDVMLLPDSNAAYTAVRGATEKDREFIASVDPWFRPVGFYTGPDGCLYVLDYYRQHIETPVSIPDSLKTDMDFLRGTDMGRIYRVVPKGGLPGGHKAFPNLNEMSSAQLVEQLKQPNQWFRLTAQRLLLERQDKSVIPALKILFEQSTDARTRLHAIYSLEALNALEASVVLKALKDPHAGVREHAMILAEKYPEALPLLIEAVNDPAAHTALQAVLSLGEFPAAKVLNTFAEVAEKRGANHWFKVALLSSKPGSSLEFFQLLVNRGSFFTEVSPQKLSFVEDYGYIIAARNNAGEISRFTQLLTSLSAKNNKWTIAGLKGIAKTMKTADKQKDNSKLKQILLQMQKNTGSPVKDSIQIIINQLSK